MPAGKILKNLKNNPQGAPMHPSPEERGVSPNVSVPHPRSVWFYGDGHKDPYIIFPIRSSIGGFWPSPCFIYLPGESDHNPKASKGSDRARIIATTRVFSAYRSGCKHGQQGCQLGKKKKIDFRMKSYFLPRWQPCCPVLHTTPRCR